MNEYINQEKRTHKIMIKKVAVYFLFLFWKASITVVWLFKVDKLQKQMIRFLKYMSLDRGRELWINWENWDKNPFFVPYCKQFLGGLFGQYILMSRGLSHS